jgi:hypothetical protein
VRVELIVAILPKFRVTGFIGVQTSDQKITCGEKESTFQMQEFYLAYPMLKF